MEACLKQTNSTLDLFFFMVFEAAYDETEQRVLRKGINLFDTVLMMTMYVEYCLVQ